MNFARLASSLLRQGMALFNHKPHPNFMLGLLSFALLLIGVVLRANNFMAGDYFLLACFGLGAAHWIWALVEVFSNKNLRGGSRNFWIILVMLVPPVGGMVYYLMRHKNVQL